MRTNVTTTSPRPFRRGFTAAELTIGMLVTALVAAAGAALTLAVSQGWKQSELTTMAQVRISRTNQTLEQLLRNARLIGRYRAGTLANAAATPAAVLVWREDLDDDGLAELDELAVVEYDGANKRLVLYKAEFESDAVRAVSNTVFATTTPLTEDGVIEWFKSSPHSTAYPLNPEGEVTGCCFNVVAANNRGSKPSFEFTLQFNAGGRTTMQYGTATLRSPAE